MGPRLSVLPGTVLSQARQWVHRRVSHIVPSLKLDGPTIAVAVVKLLPMPFPHVFTFIYAQK